MPTPTLKDVAIAVSSTLSDQKDNFEFVRWTRNDMTVYASNGLAQLASDRPDLFTQPRKITLVPGMKQQLPDDVASLGGILDNGNPNNPMGANKDDLGLIRSFNKPTCLYNLDEHGNVVYSVTSYSYDTRVPEVFYVSPPVPAGGPPQTITISAVMDPPTLTSADWLKELPIGSKYIPALKAWMLSEAYGKDLESQSSFRSQQFHRAEYYKMLGLKYTMDSKFNSGWYNGQRGFDSNVKGQ